MIALAILAATTINFNSIKADSWTAGPTKFTQMSLEQRQNYLMKDNPVPKIHRSAIVSLAIGESMSLPASWSWIDYQTPVKDQGECGSCWAFATLGATEAAYRIALDDPSVSIDLSEQFALSCLPGSCNGGMIETVLVQLSNNGIPDEPCFPYKGNRITACDWKCDDWKARTFRIVDWAWIMPTDDSYEDIKGALLRGPVVTVMVVYSDLWAYQAGIYEHVWGAQEGFHAVLIVGYDQDCWIVKNSWGSDWGESGYFRIREGQVGIASYGAQVYVKPEDVPDVSKPPITGCGCSMVY